jgi:hypothetical protein
MGSKVDAYIEKRAQSSAKKFEDRQRSKIATDLHLFRRYKAFSDKTQHYHHCQDDKELVRRKDGGCDVVSYCVAPSLTNRIEEEALLEL